MELALKAAILNLDCTKSQLKDLKGISHNLHKLTNRYESTVDNSFLRDDEKRILRQMNKYYKDKGLEYFTDVVMYESLQAFKNFPDILLLERLSSKLNKYVIENEYFINAATSEEPNSGLIAFF